MTHLGRYYRKSPARFSGSCRLYRSVQCQYIRLERDILNLLYDASDCAGVLPDFKDRLNHGLHLVTASGDQSAYLVHLFAGHHGVIGVALNAVRYLVDIGRQFLHGASLLRGSLGKDLGAVCNLLGASRHLICRTGNLHDRTV